jgi:hypothetical protein
MLVEIISWIADGVVASLKKAKQEDHDNFMGLLRNDRESVINHLYPQMDCMPAAYSDYSGEVVVLSAEGGDRDVSHLLARKVTEHLRKILLNPAPT